MNESITRAAGGVNGQEMDADSMRTAIRSIGREPRQRTTLYGAVQSSAMRPTARRVSSDASASAASASGHRALTYGRR